MVADARVKRLSGIGSEVEYDVVDADEIDRWLCSLYADCIVRCCFRVVAVVDTF